MKRFLLILLVFFSISPLAVAQEHLRYALVWNDEFNDNTLDNTVWTKIRRGNALWTIHMSSDDRLYDLDGGDLVLRGMVNDFLPNDTARFLTGGVWSKNKKRFGSGRIEIRARFDVAPGFWPAIWLLPHNNHALAWPYGGEIDIMEHFSTDPFVNQTVHSNYTYYLRRGNRPSQVAYPAYHEGEYNTYGVERYQDSVVFFVNGKRTFTYPRFRDGNDGQFPFAQHDYYLILDAQLGYRNGPAIDTAQLPVELRVDYVRYYELDSKTDVIPEPQEFQQTGKKLKKLRRIVYDENTHFDHPDEYRLEVKCGKATISGNRHWAEATLNQLTDGGKICNLTVQDRATCLYRGISLDRYNSRLTFEEVNRILEMMAFYKLNYLQWDGMGACSEEEVNLLREHASDLGIAMVASLSTIPDLDRVGLNEDGMPSTLSQVFQQAASKNGGLFFLNAIELEDREALEAFSERYWRGGDAGEGTVELGMPNELTPAGSRLANFKEKVIIHRERYHF